MGGLETTSDVVDNVDEVVEPVYTLTCLLTFTDCCNLSKVTYNSTLSTVYIWQQLILSNWRYSPDNVADEVEVVCGDDEWNVEAADNYRRSATTDLVTHSSNWCSKNNALFSWFLLPFKCFNNKNGFEHISIQYTINIMNLTLHIAHNIT